MTAYQFRACNLSTLMAAVLFQELTTLMRTRQLHKRVKDVEFSIPKNDVLVLASYVDNFVKRLMEGSYIFSSSEEKIK